MTEGAMPTVKGNVIDSSFYAGIFAEQDARPNIVNNTFSGGDAGSPIQVPRGLGILFILSAKGLVGKNQFEDYTVSPIMVFTRCHPMLKQNSYLNVHLSEDRQASLEANLLKQFHSELQEDSYFYIVDSQQKEEALWEVILRGGQQV
jgi:parallel beta-helix repeat protein